MKSILKHFLPLIIGLFFIVTMTIVLLFVFVDCEKDNNRKIEPSKIRIIVSNPDDLNVNTKGFTFKPPYEDMHITLESTNYPKGIRVWFWFDDEQNFEGRVDSIYQNIGQDETDDKWQLCDELKEKGYYIIWIRGTGTIDGKGCQYRYKFYMTIF